MEDLFAIGGGSAIAFDGEDREVSALGVSRTLFDVQPQLARAGRDDEDDDWDDEDFDDDDEEDDDWDDIDDEEEEEEEDDEEEDGY